MARCCSVWRRMPPIMAACALLLPAESGATRAVEVGPPGANGVLDSELNLLLLEVVLDDARLADVLSAYQIGDDVFLPVGELARLLTIGITVDRTTQTASGFLVTEEQPFRLDPSSGSVILSGGREAYDPGLVQWIDGDLYVASRLLQRWWPVDFGVDMAALRLDVKAREKLPLQAKIEREKAGQRISGNDPRPEPGYPSLPSDYDMLSFPFIDNTLALDVRGSGDDVKVNAAYSGFMTGDLLGMEAAAYLAVSGEDKKPQARITLARHDPDGGLLGPLEAKSVILGSIGIPAVENILRSAGVGTGILVSNRPLNLPTSYRSETLRGDLPPGWDVTLYFNDALIGFQQARGDGLYEFVDQPLVYGRNEFRLVFNGPLGQTRVERQVFQLDEMLSAPGELIYTAAAQRNDQGGMRQTLQVDFSVFEDLGIALGGVHTDRGSGSASRAYANAGARVALPGALATLDYVHTSDGGNLIDFGVRTSIGGISIDANRIWANGFISEFLVELPDPVEVRDRLRMTGTLALSDWLKLPIAFDLEREEYASGNESLKVQQRLSLNVWRTSFTNLLEWRSLSGSGSFGGVLQVSRRLAGLGLSGQAAYSIVPRARLNSFALSIDRNIGVSGRAFLGALHDLDTGSTVATGGFNRNFGNFALGLSGMFAGLDNYGLGLQVFTAIGRNPHTGGIASDWRPMAASGTVAAQVFIDDNLNGRRDSGEDPVEGVSFRINGNSLHPERTDEQGIVLLNRLPPKDYVDIGLDAGTLEDAQLQPAVVGVRVLPRPGKVLKVDVPVVLTGEIDGTVYLVAEGESRGIGNAIVELVDAQGKVAATARSASDGFYVLSGVRPNQYRVRISPEQTGQLGLLAAGEASVAMPRDPDFISGIDLEVRRKPDPAAAGLAAEASTGLADPANPVAAQRQGSKATAPHSVGANAGSAIVEARADATGTQPGAISPSRASDRASAAPVSISPAAGTRAESAAVSQPLESAAGLWRVQLGAYSVPGNAERLWSRLSGRAEIRGKARLMVRAGKITKLQAGGFASRNAAETACRSLKSDGEECLVTR